MFKIGTVCMKIAGRDAGRTCVVVDEPEKGFALVEGEVRRRKVNVKHLEPLGREVKVKKGESHEAVMKALGLEPRKSKPKKAAEKPKRKVAVKETAEPAKRAPAKKAAKKAPAKKTAAKPEQPAESSEAAE